MRVLELRLENEDYARLAAIAARRGSQPEELAARGLLEWVGRCEKESAASDEEMKHRFLKLRLADKPFDAIAAELQVSADTLKEWDRSIKQSPAEWSKAFAFANRSTDALTWEMKLKERFFDLWGHRPAG